MRKYGIYSVCCIITIVFIVSFVLYSNFQKSRDAGFRILPIIVGGPNTIIKYKTTIEDEANWRFVLRVSVFIETKVVENLVKKETIIFQYSFSPYKEGCDVGYYIVPSSAPLITYTTFTRKRGREIIDQYWKDIIPKRTQIRLDQWLKKHPYKKINNEKKPLPSTFPSHLFNYE